MVAAGFPEESMLQQVYNFTGPDPKLDMVIALMCMGLYPNVCYHKEKRKVSKNVIHWVVSCYIIAVLKRGPIKMYKTVKCQEQNN